MDLTGADGEMRVNIGHSLGDHKRFQMSAYAAPYLLDLLMN